MFVPILATKLFIPPPPPELVRRPRLIARLNEGLQAGRRLALISAPAGFGKSTLVAEWVADGLQAAWLSLDEGDAGLERFLTYLVAAVRTVAPGIGEEVLGALQSPQLPPAEPILSALLNDVSALAHDFILVLDDYHVLDARPVDHALAFLVEHLPPQMRLVIASREDPPLPLARLRAKGQLTELRAGDLRFTPAEAAEFLRAMRLHLSAEDVAALEGRTEGWIAGLQLAALSMQGRSDIHGFVQAFTGSHRYIIDYLVEEVLRRQPAEIRSFLLQTAILDQFSGPLCEAVTNQQEGAARLEALERGNFFVIPLDDQRQWYRYHHLFAEVLNTHLRAEQPDRIPALHRRASLWYERNGLPAEAIRHALAAEDFERAADLIERAVPAMRQSRQESTLLGWLKALPEAVFQNRPVLSVHYAGTLLQNGQLEGVEARLRIAERWLAEDIRERPVFVDEEDFHRLPGSVAMYHAGIALVRGDVANTVKHARQVLELVREDDDFLRGAASSLLGLAAWTGGDLETAHRMYAEGMAHLLKAGYIADVVGGSVALADIRIAQGCLREAMSTYERGLQLATKPGAPPLRGAADMHAGMSELYRERNDLDTAAQHLLKCKELGELNGLPKNPYRWRVAMARIHEARGELDQALELLDEAARLYVGDFSPNVRPVPALRARVWIGQGRLGEALGWAREQGLSAGDDLSYLREFEHITLARILLAAYQQDRAERSILDAMSLLERLLQAAQEGRRIGSAIEILALQAVANQMRGDMSSALGPLEQALNLAEPGWWVRVFLDEGPPMAALLAEAAKRGIAPHYVRQLLDAFGMTAAPAGGRDQTALTQPLAEPLSQRELAVLRLLRTELSGPEIARELSVSLNTLHTHTRNIYGKLGVNSRQAAVRRSEELNLL